MFHYSNTVCVKDGQSPSKRKEKQRWDQWSFTFGTRLWGILWTCDINSLFLISRFVSDPWFLCSFVLAFCVHFHLYTALTKHYNNERVKNKNTFVLTPDSIITGCWSQLLPILQLGHSRQGVTLLTLSCCFSPQDVKMLMDVNNKHSPKSRPGF